MKAAIELDVFQEMKLEENTGEIVIRPMAEMMDAPLDFIDEEDELTNVLIGLSELHDIRCKKLFNVFETMVKERRFTGMGEKNPDLSL